MPTPETPTPGARRRAMRLTPEAVRRREFIRTPLGRRGYLESDVDRFRVLVADEIAFADAEKAELRGELDRLRNYFRDHRIDPATGAPNGTRPTNPAGPSVQAVNMMSMAQQAADQHIAQAESYAREMVGDARKQYEQILLTAQARAEEAAAEAARAFETAESINGRAADSEELASKIAYLRTFAEVTQVQMRSILQALGQELERLAVPGAPATGPASGPGSSTDRAAAERAATERAERDGTERDGTERAAADRPAGDRAASNQAEPVDREIIRIP